MLAGAAVAQAVDLDVRHYRITNDVSTTTAPVRTLSWLQGESVKYSLWVHRGSAAVPLDAAGLTARWEAFASESSAAYILASGTITTPAAGLVQFDLTPAEANLPTGAYTGYVKLYQSVAGTNRYVGAADRRAINVMWGPSATNTTYVGPFTNAVTYETDPVFVASAAALITGADTSRWNSAASGNHAALSSLLWTASGHTGTPARLAGFFEGGQAGYSSPGAGLYFDGDDKLAVSNAVLAGAAAGATALQAEADPTVAGAVSAHNTNAASHSALFAAARTNATHINGVAVATVTSGAAAGETAVQPTDAAYTNTQALAAGDHAGACAAPRHRVRRGWCARHCRQ
jgi:hypothetical protein